MIKPRTAQRSTPTRHQIAAEKRTAKRINRLLAPDPSLDDLMNLRVRCRSGWISFDVTRKGCKASALHVEEPLSLQKDEKDEA